MTGRERMLRALACQKLERPPIWIMRQAGRYLPEYRALKEKYDFVEMVKSPPLATEVTLQPLQRFNLDAAIVFSDILVVNEAMGQPYGFREAGGIKMEFPIEELRQVRELDHEGAVERLAYVGQTIKMLRDSLQEEKAVLGFCGSPWTLACYAVEGGSAEGFPKTMALANEDPAILEKLLEKFSKVLVRYARLQAKSGADAIQIFDTWGNLCPQGQYEKWSLKWILEIVEELGNEIPLILYARNCSQHLETLASTKINCLSVDHSQDILEIRKKLAPEMAVQGNLNPELLEKGPDKVEVEARSILERMQPHSGHIFNLGHGIRPMAKIECMETLVETVTNFAKTS